MEDSWYPRNGHTAYSEIWSCSAAFIGGGSTAEINRVRCPRAAAQCILRRSDSAWTNAPRWVSRVGNKRCMACEVEATLALRCASMCRTRRIACTWMALPDCLCVSVFIAVWIEKCCNISCLSRTKACSSPSPLIAAPCTPRLPAASAACRKSLPWAALNCPSYSLPGSGLQSGMHPHVSSRV